MAMKHDEEGQQNIHELAASESSYIPACMKIRLSDLAKLQAKYLLSKVKADAEHRNVTVVVLSEWDNGYVMLQEAAPLHRRLQRS